MKKNSTYLLGVILMLTTCFINAQETKKAETNSTIDSLLGVLKTLSSPSAESSHVKGADTSLVNTLNKLSWEYILINNSELALHYANQANQQAEKSGYKKGLAKSYLNLGYVCEDQGDFEKALNYHFQYLKIQEEMGIKEGIALSFSNIGNIYLYQGNYSKCLENYLKSLKSYEVAGNKQGIANSYNLIGSLYKYQGNNEKSLENYLLSLKMQKDLRDEKGMASSYNNIGIIYAEQKNYTKALEYYLLSLKMKEKVNDKQGIAKTYNNIGIIYYYQRSYQKTLENYFKSLKIREEIGDQEGIASSYINIANIYTKQEKYEEANNYLTQSLLLSKKIGAANLIKESYSSLSELFEKKGDYKQAFNYHKLYSDIKDTLLNEQSSKQITEMNAKYESEKKEKDIKLLTKDNALQEAEMNKQKVIIYSIAGITLLLLIFATFIYRGFRQKQLLNMELEKLSIVASETDNGVLICGPRGEIEWANAGLTRLLGYSLEEIKQRGNTLEEVSSSGEIKNLIHQGIENKKTSVYETLNVAKDGKKRWLQSTLTPILDEKGNVKKLVVIDTDISERKEIEEKLSIQNVEMAKKNLKIIDSITYAKQIQQSILIEENEILNDLPHSFIYYQPKDIVSGDFYWFSKVDDILILAAIDCTGHGVPGAFMSMIGNTLLNQIVNEKHHTKPSEILRLLNLGIYSSLHQHKEGAMSHDGMDMALCSIDYKNNEVQFAGAQNPLFVVFDNNVEVIKADVHTIGGGGKLGKLKNPMGKTYTNHHIQIKKDMCIYLFSDGYMDQFGGPVVKKFGIQRFKDIVLNNQHLNMRQQKEQVIAAFEDWKGTLMQTDDILVIGLKF